MITRYYRWISLPYQKDLTLGLSISACEMLLVLKDHLLEVDQLISKPLFKQFWETMAENLNTFIFDEVWSINMYGVNRQSVGLLVKVCCVSNFSHTFQVI